MQKNISVLMLHKSTRNNMSNTFLLLDCYVSYPSSFTEKSISHIFNNILHML